MPKSSKAAVPKAKPPAGKAAPEKNKSLEQSIWDAACSIRGAKDAPKYKDFIIGKSYEYLTSKFAEGGGQSAGEFYTPPEVGTIMSKVLQPEPGMEICDPTCGSGGLLIKCEIAMEEAAKGKKRTIAPLKLYSQEYVVDTWAMACMNMIIHDMEGTIEIGDTFKNPKFRDKRGKLRTFDRVVANPM